MPATETVDLSSIACRVKPTTLKMVFTASQLDFQHQKAQGEVFSLLRGQVAA